MSADKVSPSETHNKETWNSTSKFSARFLGSMPVSRLYSQTVQPWVMAEVHRKREHVQDVLIKVLGEHLLVCGAEGQEQQLLFEHHLKGVTRFAKMHQDPKCFAYLTRYQLTADFQCHVFLADSEEMIPQLFRAIRDASKDICSKSVTGELHMDSKSGVEDRGDADRSKSLFEVKYLGRAKIGSRRVTSDYIDSLGERLISRETKFAAEKLDERRKQEEQTEEGWRGRHASGASIKSLPETLEDVAEDLATENKLEEQKMMLMMNRSSPMAEVLPEGSFGNGEITGSCSLQKAATGSVEHVNLTADHISDSESSRDSLNSSFEQKLNMLNFTKGKELKTLRSSTTAVAARRRHSSQSEDKSWSGSKFSFQDAGHDRHHQDYSESQESICSIYKQQEISRVMVLQISQQNICLISLDKKISVLECKFTDIAFVSQGSHKKDLFAIVARDADASFFCYILRCLSPNVVEEILSTLQTAFTTACNKKGDNVTNCVGETATISQNQTCSTCPLLQFHKICQEIHALPPQAAYDLVVKRVHCLPDKEFHELNRLIQNEAPESFDESLEVMMIFLRQLCEKKQREHFHILENIKSSKSDMNLLEEKPSLLEGLRNKAKKSLTTSFEQLLSRGKKKEDGNDSFRQRSWTTDSETSWTSRDSSTTSTPDVSPMPSPMRKEFHDFPSPPSSPGPHEPHRKRSATMEIPGSTSRSDAQFGRRRDVNHNTTASPMKTMFLLSTSSPQQSDSLSSSTQGSPLEDRTLLTPSRRPSSSFRKTIFNKVCTPQHSIEFGEENPHTDLKLHNTCQVRAMWRKLIMESLLLIRMEKENHNIRARQEEGGVTLSHKLEYQELTPCLKEITSLWEKMLEVNDGDEEEVGEALLTEGGKTVPRKKLLEYVKKGVPRTLRGQIWLFLMQQQQMCQTVPDSACESAGYEDLLKQLTTHQHAILIDLGRTFPSHPYFCKSLGAGQLELFNLLKAYSLLDSEVGYCQGLSFIVGMLLMHMEEISAFHVLKYLMYDLGLRRQFRPNMVALQLKLYQLTRLLHDRYKNVYDHFETHEISPTLYAAPWFLTMFASQFPLGFVARVFDMIFIQGIDALFKVALTLIGSHHALILQCDSFETIVDFLKITLPEMVQVQMERIINQAFELDIDRDLQQYEVEYYVLSEEAIFSAAHHHHPPLHQHQSHYHEKNLSPSAGVTFDRSSRRSERRTPSVDVDLLYRLESQNLSLKNQNQELLEKLQQAQSQRKSSELSVLTQQVQMDKLKAQIQSLELERSALLSAVAQLRSLVPQESLQHLQLSLPPTSTPSSDLPSSSNVKTVMAQNLTLNASINNDSLADNGLTSCDTKSLFRKTTNTSKLTAHSTAQRGSNQISESQISDLDEVKSSTNSISHGSPKSASVKRESHQAATSFLAAATMPSSVTSTAFSSLSCDMSKVQMHSQRTKTSAGIEPLSQTCPASSCYSAQTCTSRSLSTISSNRLSAGSISPERRNKSVTVVVQQLPMLKNSQTSSNSER